ncbi:MAG TPA: 6,7-dimethyl-8-ribityllumazine synthase [Gaiellaceae bacterium]|nr:6,7-dimethyl-8-ribityllumazine synthase [Gaiellaceae bacterium]
MSSSSGGFWPGDEPEDDETGDEDLGVTEPEPEAASESTGWQLPEPESEPEPEPDPVIAHRPGEIDVPGGIAVIEGAPFGSGRSVGIVVARFNSEISNALLESALEALAAAGVEQDRITVMPVPGAFELPIGAMALAKTRRYSCVIGLGCVIRGETPHFDFVATEAASGLQLAGLETGVPVAFGVLTVDTIEQAQARLHKGGEAARAALEMADIFSQVRAQVRASG